MMNKPHPEFNQCGALLASGIELLLPDVGHDRQEFIPAWSQPWCHIHAHRFQTCGRIFSDGPGLDRQLEKKG